MKLTINLIKKGCIYNILLFITSKNMLINIFIRFEYSELSSIKCQFVRQSVLINILFACFWT